PWRHRSRARRPWRYVRAPQAGPLLREIRRPPGSIAANHLPLPNRALWCLPDIFRHRQFDARSTGLSSPWRRQRWPGTRLADAVQGHSENESLLSAPLLHQCQIRFSRLRNGLPPCAEKIIVIDCCLDELHGVAEAVIPLAFVHLPVPWCGWLEAIDGCLRPLGQ